MITFTLPWPTRDLSPNGRLHWAAKAKAVAKARKVAYLTTREATASYWVALYGVQDHEKISVRMACVPATRRRRDMDNLIASTKAYRDGIADALGINDSRFVIINELWDEYIKGGEVRVTLKTVS